MNAAEKEIWEQRHLLLEKSLRPAAVRIHPRDYLEAARGIYVVTGGDAIYGLTLIQDPTTSPGSPRVLTQSELELWREWEIRWVRRDGRLDAIADGLDYLLDRDASQQLGSTEISRMRALIAAIRIPERGMEANS